MEKELTIVIPAKNEAALLPALLRSIHAQDYPALPLTPIIVADAGSTDGTLEIVKAFSDRLQIRAVTGGLPSVGRNAGAFEACSTFVLFLDADVELHDPTLVRRAVELATRRKLDCVSTCVWIRNGYPFDNGAFALSNLAQRLSRWFGEPFGIGMFLLFRTAAFRALGGFDEQALYAEDYQLTRQVPRRRFAIVPGTVWTSDRRLRKNGYRRMAYMFLQTALHGNDQAYFRRKEHMKYWK